MVSGELTFTTKLTCHLKAKPISDQFWICMLKGSPLPLPKSFPISGDCKLETSMDKPKCPPWTPNVTNVTSGLAAQACQFHRPCHNLAWCSFPSESNSEQIHLISPPWEFTIQQPKEIYLTKIPAQHSWQVIHLNLNTSVVGGCTWKIGKNVRYGFSPITAEVTDKNVRKSVCE